MEISVYKGVITHIEVLPNRESPRFLKKVLDSGLLSQLVGKTVKEAKGMHLDAVSGATFTSNALIRNIQLGLEDGGASQKKAPKAPEPSPAAAID